jgi:hypothetical protein
MTGNTMTKLMGKKVKNDRQYNDQTKGEKKVKNDRQYNDQTNGEKR